MKITVDAQPLIINSVTLILSHEEASALKYLANCKSTTSTAREARTFQDPLWLALDNAGVEVV